MAVRAPLGDHQEAFLRSFFETDAPKAVILIAPPGTGKSRAVTAVIRHAVATQDMSSILVLVPAALTKAVVASLDQENMDEEVVVIDRQGFRSLVSTPTLFDDPWPARTIVVM